MENIGLHTNIHLLNRKVVSEMDWSKAASELAQGMIRQNEMIIQNMVNPVAAVIFPSYEDWKKSIPPCENPEDTSMERYWNERKRAIRMFALAELDGGDCGREC